MHNILKIARMELYRTAMNRVFMLLTLLGPFLFCSVAILPGVLAKSGAFRNEKTATIAVFGADTALFEAIQPVLLREKINIVQVQAAVGTLQTEFNVTNVDGYLIIPADPSITPIEYKSKRVTDFRIRNILETTLGNALLIQNFAQAGIGENEALSIMRPIPFSMSHVSVDGIEKKSPDFTMILTVSLLFASLLYLTIIFYGQVVGRSVLMEKTNKTVEILLSSVRPVDIMFGKLLGNALASLLQYSVWIGISVSLIKLIGPHFGFAPNIVLNLGTYLHLVLYFILAYFLYCSVYAALGSASRDEQQLSQLSLPVIVVLIIPVMLITAIIASPQAPVVIALSLFPLTAPIVMFIRILLGAVTVTEIIVSVLLMLAAISGCVAHSARIFNACILLNGKTIDFDILLQWFRVHKTGGVNKSDSE